MTRDIHDTPRAAAAAAAAILVDAMSRGQTVALPTGRTAERVYRAVVAHFRAADVSFRRARVFNLDELEGLPSTDRRRFASVIQRRLLRHVDVAPSRVHLLAIGRDPQRDAQAYDAAIDAAGGFDLVVLGIGTNGHIAFNEPAPALPAATHRVRLSASTRRTYATRWRGRLPTHALTVGMAQILRSRRILLVATGRDKADAVARALTGPITTRVPASFLQLHRDVCVVLDRAAASRIDRPRPTARTR
jgi:glucosamine-6-phosphate deaminase